VIFKSADGCFTKENHRFWTPQNVIFGSFGVGPARPGGQPTAQEFYDNNIKMSVFIFLDRSKKRIICHQRFLNILSFSVPPAVGRAGPDRGLRPVFVRPQKSPHYGPDMLVLPTFSLTFCSFPVLAAAREGQVAEFTKYGNHCRWLSFSGACKTMSQMDGFPKEYYRLCQSQQLIINILQSRGPGSKNFAT